MDLQPLLTTILGYRPDLAAESLRVMVSLRDAVRRVAQETLLLRHTVSIPYDAGDWTTGPFGEGVARIYEIPSAGTNWPADVKLEILRFIGLTCRGPLGSAPVQSLGSMQFDAMVNQVSGGASMPADVPSWFCDRMGVLNVFPAVEEAACDTLILTVAVQPQGDFTEVPGLHPEAREAVLNFALADVLCLAGRYQNPGMGAQRLAMALNLAGKLRSMNVLGTSGNHAPRPNPFDFQVGR